jgi:hypothetical protein
MCFTFNKRWKKYTFEHIIIQKGIQVKVSQNIYQYWHYLECHKLSFNLLWNNIQLHALVKYTMLLINFLLEFLIFFKSKKIHTQIALYITMGIYI